MQPDSFKGFSVPDASYAPYPFWFLNDALEEAELLRQIDDFHDKGVGGFVLHPRIGLPKDVPYLSDAFMRLMTACVRRAKAHGMKVILYDEAMYPSGSCHGMVVQENPAYAARSLECRKGLDCALAPNESIVARYGVRFAPDGAAQEAIMLSDGTALPEGFAPYTLVCGFTGGTIRGIHADEDDGMPGAPKAADLLSEQAMALFIHLTHDRYAQYMAEFFGDTVLGFFTDEPSVTGRGCGRNTIPWTPALTQEYFAYTDAPLPALFFDMGPVSAKANRALRAVVRARLTRVYYGQIASWCRSHNLHLMGHPAQSDETDAQALFGVPGQDLVWRYIAPEYNLDSPHSVLGKNSADMARQLGARRNSNEVLGVCGKQDNPWEFSCTDMIWYFNWLLARGVNMIIPHAFYYSVRTPLQSGERPPDVGPNNIWWPQYRRISDYTARLCWLNTDSVNHPACAVLCENETMPCAPVKPLYENGIDFNYVNASLFARQARLENGVLHAGAYAYDTILCDCAFTADDAVRAMLDEFVAQGGNFYQGEDFLGYLCTVKTFDNHFESAQESAKQLRQVHVTKDGLHYVLLFNECDERELPLSGTLHLGVCGKLWALDPYTGQIGSYPAHQSGDTLALPVSLEAYECKVFAVDPAQPFKPTPALPAMTGCLPVSVRAGRETFGATEPVTFSGKFTLSKAQAAAQIVLTCETLLEQASITVNGQTAGDLVFRPYRADLTGLCREGENELEICCLPSRCNIYGKKKDCTIGGVRICLYEK